MPKYFFGGKYFWNLETPVFIFYVFITEIYLTNIWLDNWLSVFDVVKGLCYIVTKLTYIYNLWTEKTTWVVWAPNNMKRICNIILWNTCTFIINKYFLRVRHGIKNILEYSLSSFLYFKYLSTSHARFVWKNFWKSLIYQNKNRNTKICGNWIRNVLNEHFEQNLGKLDDY